MNRFTPKTGMTPEQIASEEFLEREEEWELARRWQDERDYNAREKILDAYKRMANKFAARASHSGLSFQDLQQEAMIGLMQALDKFDPERGYGFGTFANYHVISRLQVYTLENMSEMRIFNTAATKKLLSQFSKLKKQIEAETGRALDEDGRDRICKELGIDRQHLKRYEIAVMNPVPLDAGAGTNDEEHTRPIEVSDQNINPESAAIENISQQETAEVIQQTVNALDERERQIWYARHHCDPPVTLDRLSKEHNISRERVRQIELQARSKIRADLQRHGITSASSVFNDK